MKAVVWMGSSRRDLKTFPRAVQSNVGHALYTAQCGETDPSAKPLKGFGGTAVMEIVERHAGDAFRAVYTAAVGDVLYVLHAFQKKSTRGIATPQREIDLIKARLKDARDLHRQNTQRQN
ncbi:MAG: type II toxin-antitoxin system RelE/ParE family toxin [Hyphomicrobiales bacterium]